MPIPLFILDRIKTAAMSGPQVADAFAALAQVADGKGINDCAVNIKYVKEDDRLILGDLIPMISLSLVRHADFDVEPDNTPDTTFTKVNDEEA